MGRSGKKVKFKNENGKLQLINRIHDVLLIFYFCIVILKFHF